MKLRNAWITMVLLTLVIVGAGAGSGAASVKGDFSVSSTIGGFKLANGVTLSGSVVWLASPNGAKVARVEFSIDGAVKWTDSTAPYQFNGDPNGVLDTSRLSNGQHKLRVKAYAVDGPTVTKDASVTIANGSVETQTAFTVSSSIADGATLSGSLAWTASPSGTSVSKVEFLIDGGVKWTESLAPYQFKGDPNGVLDTSRLTNGQHKLGVKAYASDGRTTSKQANVTVNNTSVQTAFTVSSSISDGATLSGSLAWTASPSGSSVSKVEFLIDGALKWTASFTPYRFNGDTGVLDTSTLSNATHTLGVKAYAVDGRTATKTASVKIANGSVQTAFTVGSSIPNKATISGSLGWTASPSGSTVSKVEFLIDGALRWTESFAPYQFNGDNSLLNTSTLTDGTHLLVVIAYATDGRTASASSSVVVTNGPAPAPSSTPSLSGIPRFGISPGYKILTRSAADQNFELNQIQAAGARIVRLDSLPGNQAQLDPVVAGVLARGMVPMLVLFGTTPPVNPSTAASFASSQAAKWKGKVRLYEFANEPDLQGWNGTNYAQALIPVYDAIKAADPNALVIAGALWKGAGGPVQFVTDMYNVGAKGHFDILSLHLYDDPFAAGTWNIWNMAFHMTPSVRSVMDAHGDEEIPIGATEAGGPVSSYGENGQASIVGHDFDALSDPRLAFVLVFAMMDDAHSGFGLLRPDRSERPALAVYKARAGA